jgi:hypothetical protein
LTVHADYLPEWRSRYLRLIENGRFDRKWRELQSIKKKQFWERDGRPDNINLKPVCIDSDRRQGCGCLLNVSRWGKCIFSLIAKV